jgi:hypothetical protein
MAENKKNSELFLGGGHLNIQSTQYVETYNSLKLITITDGAIELNVEIKADFSKIPEKYHEVFLNMMTTKYYGRVSFGDNPFSKCLPPIRKKWYQFWK